METVHINRSQTYHERELAVNMICCANEERLSAPLINLVRESQEETPLGSIEFWESLTLSQRQEMLAMSTLPVMSAKLTSLGGVKKHISEQL